MLQSTMFMSGLGVGYAGLSQAECDAKAAAIVACYRALQTGTYTTPNVASSGTADLFNTNLINAHWAALLALYTAQRAGDVALAHADCDKANGFAAQIGQPVISCLPDIQILCNAPGMLGQVAQAVAGGFFAIKVKGVEVQLSDLDTVAPVIDAAIATVPTPPPPAQPAAAPYIDLDGPLPGYFVGQTVPFPGGSLWAYCALPFGPPPLNQTFRLVRIA